MPEYLLSSGLPSYPAGLNDKDTALVLPVYRAVNNLANKVSAVTGQQQFAPLSGFLRNRCKKMLDQLGIDNL